MFRIYASLLLHFVWLAAFSNRARAIEFEPINPTYIVEALEGDSFLPLLMGGNLGTQLIKTPIAGQALWARGAANALARARKGLSVQESSNLSIDLLNRFERANAIARQVGRVRIIDYAWASIHAAKFTVERSCVDFKDQTLTYDHARLIAYFKAWEDHYEQKEWVLCDELMARLPLVQQSAVLFRQALAAVLGDTRGLDEFVALIYRPDFAEYSKTANSVARNQRLLRKLETQIDTQNLIITSIGSIDSVFYHTHALDPKEYPICFGKGISDEGEAYALWLAAGLNADGEAKCEVGEVVFEHQLAGSFIKVLDNRGGAYLADASYPRLPLGSYNEKQNRLMDLCSTGSSCRLKFMPSGIQTVLEVNLGLGSEAFFFGGEVDPAKLFDLDEHAAARTKGKYPTLKTGVYEAVATMDASLDVLVQPLNHDEYKTLDEKNRLLSDKKFPAGLLKLYYDVGLAPNLIFPQWHYCLGSGLCKHAAFPEKDVLQIVSATEFQIKNKEKALRYRLRKELKCKPSDALMACDQYFAEF